MRPPAFQGVNRTTAANREPRRRDLPVFHEFVHQRQQRLTMRFDQRRGARVFGLKKHLDRRVAGLHVDPDGNLRIGQVIKPQRVCTRADCRPPVAGACRASAREVDVAFEAHDIHEVPQPVFS